MAQTCNLGKPGLLLCSDLILGLDFDFDFQQQHQSISMFGPPLQVCGLTTLKVEPPDNLTADVHPIASYDDRKSEATR